MQRKKYLVLMTLLFAAIITSGIAQVVVKKRTSKGDPPKTVLEVQGEAPIDLQVQTVSGAIYSTKNAPIDVIFHNNTQGRIKLLDAFSSTEQKKVFFKISLHDSNQVPIFSAGGGKIALSDETIKYRELEAGAEMAVRLNLIDFLPSNVSLETGIYVVTVTYRNQYGEGCFKGTLKSEPLNLSLNNF